MDIIYKLPFPEEICNKIFTFACKSRHIDLSASIVKRIIKDSGIRNNFTVKGGKKDSNTIYDELVNKGGIVMDENGDVVILYTEDDDGYSLIHYYDKLEVCFDLYSITCLLPKLTMLCLSDTGINGNMVHLKMLPNLMHIDIADEGVYGDILHLKWLSKLSKIFLFSTLIYGNIVNMKSLYI